MTGFYARLAAALALIVFAGLAAWFIAQLAPRLGVQVFHAQLGILSNYTVRVAGGSLRLVPGENASATILSRWCSPSVSVSPTEGFLEVGRSPICMGYAATVTLPERLRHLRVEVQAGSLLMKGFVVDDLVIRCVACSAAVKASVGNATLEFDAASAAVKLRPLSNSTMIRLLVNSGSVALLIEGQARVETLYVHAGSLAVKGCRGGGPVVEIGLNAASVAVKCTG